MRKDLEEKLQSAEDLFSQFAENNDSVVWIVTMDANRIVYINDAYEQIWGRSCQSLIDEPRSWLDAVYPEDRVDVSEFVTGDSQKAYLKKEYRIIRPDGTIHWIRDRSFPIRNKEGVMIYIAGIAEDITEEKRLRKEAEHRLKQIIQADKLASLGEVVAGVAHEINNPNSFIAYNIPLLEQTWKLLEPIIAEYALSHPDWKADGLGLDELSEDMKDIIQDLKDGSDRINKVVKNLKDFARMDESGHPVSVQVNHVVNKTMVIVGSQVRKLAADIVLNLGENVPEIEGYFSKLEQVFANLLVNAAHSIDDKERGKITVATRWVERLQAVLIEVEDNGRGMEAETAEHIFDPFFTTRRAAGGTGLGLSVTYGLVQEHGGIIGLLSRPGLGSRFSVYLPVDRSVALEIQPTILCVDDDAAFLNMLRTQFSRVNKCSAGLNDPESVLSYLEEHPEAYAVLSDLMMPNVNGWELFSRVKKRFPLLPFILYSGDPVALEAKPKGIPTPAYMLHKPFGMEQLARIISSIAVL